MGGWLSGAQVGSVEGRRARHFRGLPHSQAHQREALYVHAWTPALTVVSDAIAYVNDHPRPLALYVFDHDEEAVEKVLAETISGGVTVNDTMLHIAQDDMPFGGVGPSGMGHYHGKEGFDTFTKKKPAFYQARLNATDIMRPP